ncbi:MAG: hypothetical protein BWY09_00994 [Candidatus Hydrogenedentes bacterium ADurb.Bin179]|nr:MAG: hypothetical protein BWY09_00994 [Candidatus Hydrogenedentes bacterium ADurb.Bin179]
MINQIGEYGGCGPGVQCGFDHRLLNKEPVGFQLNNPRRRRAQPQSDLFRMPRRRQGPLQFLSGILRSGKQQVSFLREPRQVTEPAPVHVDVGRHSLFRRQGKPSAALLIKYHPHAYPCYGHIPFPPLGQRRFRRNL